MLSLALITAVNAEVNGRFQHCRAWSCTSDFRPAWTGDCKQAAAMKLQHLLAVGAKPDEFVIWIVRQPSGGRHAVLLQRGTDLVLDTYTTTVCGPYGCSMSSPVEPRRIKEKHEGMAFEGPCPSCAVPAVIAVAELAVR